MAYKVVTPDLVSCLHTVHDVSVQYKVNKMVTPKYPSFVFKDLSEARIWAFRHLRLRRIEYQIWRCQTKGLRMAEYLLSLDIVRSGLDKFWRFVLVHSDPIPGTYICPKDNPFYIADSVKLVKRVS